MYGCEESAQMVTPDGSKEWHYAAVDIKGTLVKFYRHPDISYNHYWLEFVYELDYCKKYGVAPLYSDRSTKWKEAELLFDYYVNNMKDPYG